MFSDTYGAVRDCRKISWYYNNNNKNQEFYWSVSHFSVIYANVIIRNINALHL